MKWQRSIMVAAVSCAACLLTWSAETPVWAADAAPIPAVAAARTQEAIVKDLQAASAELSSVMPPLTELMNEKNRAEAAPKIIPPLKKMSGLMAEFAKVSNEPGLFKDQSKILAMLDFLGDADSEKALKSVAAGADAVTSLQAKLGLALADWWKNSQNAAGQTKVLDSIETLAKANPTDDTITQYLLMMKKMGASSADLSKRANQIIVNDLTGELAQASRTAAVEGEPLAFSGPSLDGKKFNTTDWKGKVILVDFWATWCGPCKAELPRVSGLYEKYHDKGLEIVGVSLDNSADDLKNYLAEHKELSWTQVYEDHAPLAQKYGIEAIPTMYLIDRQGVLRTVEAREQLEDMIPKLLAEGAPATQPSK